MLTCYVEKMQMGDAINPKPTLIIGKGADLVVNARRLSSGAIMLNEQHLISCGQPQVFEQA